ncbi:Ankyrin repeat domain-containing protein [Paramyrothecium foliicola]|nr:Ankyrin repeat domain-containing protein [Paramyrothecium foliicola]
MAPTKSIASAATQGLDPTEKVIDTLFRIILDKVAEYDVFSHSHSPSIFLVYAHDTDTATADARCVHLFADWLRVIQSRTLSDKSPLPLIATRDGGTDAVRNILSNQFCLLPKRTGSRGPRVIESVDKAVVFGSGVLRRYYEDNFTPNYIAGIQELYRQSPPALNNSQALQDEIREYVEGQCSFEPFHHVLTELAFLTIRHQNTKDAEHGIIPVALDGELMAYLPFLTSSDLVLKLTSPNQVDRHKLFFKLLRQIYPTEHTFIQGVEDCYNSASRRLEGKDATQVEIEVTALAEFRGALQKVSRLQSAAFRDERRSNPLNDHAVELDARKARLLASLSTLSYRDRKDRNPVRVEGTCKWFTSHSLFKKWQNSDTLDLLWVSADPGCGKSVLAKHLIDNVLPRENAGIICYFFFKDDFEDQRNVESALRCLLHQIFAQNPDLLCEEVLTAFGRDGQLFASFTGLWDILNWVAAKNNDKIICVLDALDECEYSGQLQLSDALERLYRKGSGSSIKFLLTSRPYSHIQRSFQILEDHQLIIHLNGENQAEVDKIAQEIDLVIDAKVEDISSRRQFTSEERDLIRRELLRVPNRTYLWIYLVFEVLQNTVDSTKSGLLKILCHLPQTVMAAYEKILSRSQDPARARRLLHIVVAAEKPLSVQEMATALALRETHRFEGELDLEPEERFRRTIRALCGLFVTITDSKVYLLHQTAREFLVQTTTASDTIVLTWQHSLRPMDSHHVLAEICIWYLGLQESSGELKTYAAHNWAAHLRKAQGTDTRHLMPLAQVLCDSALTRPEHWFRNYWKAIEIRVVIPKLDSLMVASYLGLEDLVRFLLGNNKWKLTLGDEIHHQSALSWACIGGHGSVVELLLDSLSSVEKWFLQSRLVNQKNRRGSTPLLLAAVKGHIDVVKLLLGKGASVDAGEGGFTPLHAATKAGHGDIVGLLLEHGANVNCRRVFKGGRTPLIDASWKGYEDIVKLLLSKGAIVNTQDHFGDTPMTEALRWGHVDIFKLLATRCEPMGSTEVSSLLSVAASKSPKDIVKFFFDGNSSMQIPGFRGHELLFLATRMADEVFLGFLVDHDKEITQMRDGEGQTALHIAASESCISIVKLLLEKKCPIDAQDVYGKTALHIAVREGQAGMVMVLLEHDAAVGLEDDEGRTPLDLITTLEQYANIRELMQSSRDSWAQMDSRQVLLEIFGHDPFAKYLSYFKLDITVLSIPYKSYNGIIYERSTLNVLMEENQTTAQPEGERRVFLREGTVVLRWLFGYFNKEQIPGSNNIPNRWPNNPSTWLTPKGKIKFRKSTLVSIDIDELKEQDGVPVQFHMGISILHTKDLQDQCHSHSSMHADGSKPYIIQSHHWVIGDRNYYAQHDDRFCFGKHQSMPLASLEKKLKGLPGSFSPLILVVHGGHREVTLLQKLDINLKPIFTVDTTKAARYPLQAFYDFTLKKLLVDFGIPVTGEHLHVAGNDAHFTLRVLLMIAVTDVRRELDELPPWVPVFETIARAPLPPMPLTRDQKAAVKRRAKRALLPAPPPRRSARLNQQDLMMPSET